MTSPSRYTPNDFGYLVPDADGKWMRVADHQSIVKELQDKFDKENDDLVTVIIERNDNESKSIIKRIAVQTKDTK